jgi:hypothetical protein
MIPKRVAILQSNYIPWRGYFDIIGLVDEFIVYDVAQYTKNDWRNRNRIRTAQGVQWLTIPIVTSGRFGQTIAEAEIASPAWAGRHWKAIAQAYARAPFFELYAPALASVFEACRGLPRLSAVNRLLIEAIAGRLGLKTAITDAAAYAFAGDRNDRLVSLCRSAGATDYLTGPSARNYLDLDRFARAGIAVEIMDYSQYAPYPQVHGGFVPDVSVLDLLFNVGADAPSYLRCGAARPPG